ncbi:MAG: hypothetical protein U0V87_16730 [Acidobacteriota bacterium]
MIDRIEYRESRDAGNLIVDVVRTCAGMIGGGLPDQPGCSRTLRVVSGG